METATLSTKYQLVLPRRPGLPRRMFHPSCRPWPARTAPGGAGYGWGRLRFPAVGVPFEQQTQVFREDFQGFDAGGVGGTRGLPWPCVRAALQ